MPQKYDKIFSCIHCLRCLSTHIFKRVFLEKEFFKFTAMITRRQMIRNNLSNFFCICCIYYIVLHTMIFRFFDLIKSRICTAKKRPKFWVKFNIFWKRRHFVIFLFFRPLIIVRTISSSRDFLFMFHPRIWPESLLLDLFLTPLMIACNSKNI